MARRMSHLLQMRGLKLKAQISETWSRTSHLLQMRGLKQYKERNSCSAVSHLLQMRGLKQYIQPGPSLTEVASFTDAWIETRRRNEH